MHSHEAEKENLHNNQELKVLFPIFFGHSPSPIVNRVFYRECGELYDENEECGQLYDNECV